MVGQLGYAAFHENGSLLACAVLVPTTDPRPLPATTSMLLRIQPAARKPSPEEAVRNSPIFAFVAGPESSPVY